jgi:hypothetical protein
VPAHAGGGLIWGSGINQINLLAVGAAAALAVLGVVLLGLAVSMSQSQMLGYVFYFVGGMSISASAFVLAPLIIAGATAVGGVDIVMIDAATSGGR